MGKRVELSTCHVVCRVAGMRIDRVDRCPRFHYVRAVAWVVASPAAARDFCGPVTVVSWAVRSDRVAWNPSRSSWPMPASIPCCLGSFNRAPCLPRADPGTCVAASRSTDSPHKAVATNPRSGRRRGRRPGAREMGVGREAWAAVAGDGTSSTQRRVDWSRRLAVGLEISVDASWERSGTRDSLSLGAGSAGHRTFLLRQHLLASPGRPKPRLSNPPPHTCDSRLESRRVGMSTWRSSQAGNPARRSENLHSPRNLRRSGRFVAVNDQSSTTQASWPLHLVVASGKPPYFVLLSQDIQFFEECDRTETAGSVQHSIWVWKAGRSVSFYP